MIALVLTSLAFLGAVFLTAWALVRADRRDESEWRATWAKDPNACVVCEFHRYGVRHQLTYRDSPRPHVCPEKTR